ncbi:hypothetical protein FHP25_23345 [Vineibacter terrae]|uniref:Uncharacterized protein n=1 Tax=Vineibacter terrae TaxID=2586908 RepID=A0A5C8PGH3_9HYPH|nr:hypothetical protein [Vineibacter terrae]TXL72922.1 hypothetical protein FHP25_23345 [Vineibacter terrae]
MTYTLPHTFEGGGYEVTINVDRSILVRQGDWLSKYSMAIYGDFNHIRKFKEKIGTNLYRDVPNPNLIRTGATLYHPDPLPDEAPVNGTPVIGPPETEPKIPQNRVKALFDWIWNRFFTCDWELEGTAGFNLSGFFISGQYMTVDVKHTAAQVTGRFYNIAGGLTLNLPKSMFGGSGSPWFFPTYGIIRRTPWRNHLTLEDFCHGTLVAEFSLAYGLGTSPSMLFFGMGMPPWRMLDALNRYLQSGDPTIFAMLVLDTGPKGVMFFAGAELSSPGVGLACRVGVMYDRLPWHAR